jgi:hypothetical protein
MTTEKKPDFQRVYELLTAMLSNYAGGTLQLRTDNRIQMELIGPPTPSSMGKEVWFGAVRIGKRYVSYYLMPVYAYPELLGGISPELKKRMQGKSCFNFTRADEQLFKELAELTQQGYERFKEKGLIR